MRALTVASAAMASLLASACASRPPSPSPFMKTGGPGFIDVGGTPPGPPSPVALEELERAKREALARREATKPAPLPSIEGQDLALRDALATLGTSPSAHAHLRVADEYVRVGVQDMAYGHYSDALGKEPRNVAALDGRARLLRDVGFLGPALADAYRAKYFDPASAEVRNTLGTILERRGLCQAALAEYREALRLKPDATWARQNVTRLADTCEENLKNP